MIGDQGRELERSEEREEGADQSMGRISVENMSASEEKKSWWSRQSKCTRWVFRFYALYIVGGIIGFAILTANRSRFSFFMFIFVFAPIVLYIPFRYMYIRGFKPFTEPVKVKADTEEDVESQTTSDTSKNGSWSRSELLGTLVFVLLLLLAFLPFILIDNLAADEPNAFAVVGYNFFGSLLIFATCALLVDFLDVMKGWYLYFGEVPSERGPFLSYFFFARDKKSQRYKALLTIFLYIALTVSSLVESYKAPDVEAVEVRLIKFPSCLNGYKILLVSDVHVGPLVGKTEAGELVQQINAQGADTVVLVGDFADSTPAKVGGAMSVFRDVEARDGVYFVPGNHEYLHGSSGEEWSDFMRGLGIVPLNNTRVQLPKDPASCATFDLVGVDDISLGKPDLKAALAGRNQSTAAVLLAHQPKQAIEASDSGVDLQLSGHTHAGQIWPLHGITYLANPHFEGLEKRKDMYVYVSQGAFGWGPRTRVGCRNHIDLLTLTSSGQPLDVPLHETFGWVVVAYPFLALTLVFCIACAVPCTPCVNAQRKYKPHTKPYH